MSLVYVLVCRLFALIVLFGRGDRSKELEILVLRHELSILRRQVRKPGFTEGDRLLLATLSRMLPRHSWHAFLVRPETLLRWHRQLVARHWTYPRRRPGRPPIGGEVHELILRLARENSNWGYVRIVGELRKLGIHVSATLVRNVLRTAGIAPAPRRGQLDWRAFLRQHASTRLACDFLSVDTVLLRRLYVLVFIRIGSRRVEYMACTSKPDGTWMLLQARNLLMDLDDSGQPPLFLIHDRDAKFSRAFEGVLQSAGIRAIRTPVKAPNANAYIERWIGTVRRECLDRLLIVNRRQLEHVLRVYTRHYNGERPHRALDLRAPESHRMAAAAATPVASATAIHRRDLARVVRYLAGESAGQCGPCVFGLAALAESLDAIARGDRNADVALAGLPRLHTQIARRGACAHPDGTLKLVESALHVFGAEVERRLHGNCSGTRAPTLPIHPPTGEWR
jgi:putative transposase